MCAEIFDLPDVGVNITQFFLDFDSTFIELTRAPLPDDEPEIVEQLTRNRSILSGLKEIYHTTPYLNKIDFIERLINYVVAYATKGEISAKDAAEMFRGIAQGDLDDSTPLASLAHKLSLRVLKSRECPRPEITLAMQGLNFFCSSRQVKYPFMMSFLVFNVFFFSCRPFTLTSTPSPARSDLPTAMTTTPTVNRLRCIVRLSTAISLS